MRTITISITRMHDMMYCATAYEYEYLYGVLLIIMTVTEMPIL